MTHELILTSVAQGLDPKDRGFCPIAANSEVSPRVVGHLTALSGYQYLITESGDLSTLSPVAYFHLILPGGLEHVLSRVAGAGTDYQGQPNAIAHHVVIERVECSAESPAWHLALPGFHFSEWNAPPIRFKRGRPIPTLTNPPSLTRRQQIARQHRWLDPHKMALTGFVDTESESFHAAVQRNDEQIVLAVPPTTPCPVWKELTGDPGWGGVLAETAYTGQPVVLIYNPEQNILPLYVEALALLPEFLAWRVTFCTYFTELPGEIPCQWKGVIAGSDEVKPLVRDLNNLVIDLTVPMGDALSGRYVDFARLGQQHMLPLDMEEHVAAMEAASADTRCYGEGTKWKAVKSGMAPSSTPVPAIVPALAKEPDPPSPKIQLPKKRGGPIETLLRKSSRFQFYMLYGIMFALVLFLLFLAIDQAGNFGIVQNLRSWKQPLPIDPLENQEPEPQPENTSELDAQSETDLEQVEQDSFPETEDVRKTYAENREQQKEPLLQFWQDFVLPEFLAINFPDVKDGLIDVPEKKLFAEFKPIHDFGAALELRFIPLFELSTMRVETSLVKESLPDLVWRVSAVDTAIDTDAESATPMYHFQLTETGLEMEWRLEGLNTQYLYDTVLSSLGFLELSVADAPESARQIAFFVPVETVPMKVSDLANLSGQEPPEYVIDLPFSSELWQEIFASMNPPRTLRLEVSAEPPGNWVRIESLSESNLCAEVLTKQQARKPSESGDTFEDIKVSFVATASLDNIIWKGDEYTERLRSELAALKQANEQLEGRVDRLNKQMFEGNQSENVRQERDGCKVELRDNALRLVEIESILEKLPEAYREIGENESGRFHYSVSLGSESTGRRLVILRTVHIEDEAVK